MEWPPRDATWTQKEARNSSPEAASLLGGSPDAPPHPIAFATPAEPVAVLGKASSCTAARSHRPTRLRFVLQFSPLLFVLSASLSAEFIPSLRKHTVKRLIFFLKSLALVDPTLVHTAFYSQALAGAECDHGLHLFSSPPLWNPGHRSGWPTSCWGHGAAPPRRLRWAALGCLGFNLPAVLGPAAHHALGELFLNFAPGIYTHKPSLQLLQHGHLSGSCS